MSIKQKLLEKYYPEIKFGGLIDIDGTLIFLNRVNSLINSTSIVLDVGCGRGGINEDYPQFKKDLKILKGKAQKVIGIDVDSDAQVNKSIDEFRLIETNENKLTWPVKSSSVDLIIAEFVLEHVSNPDEFFSEASRVLKKGGYFCFRTTNLLSYVGLIASIIPNKYHSNVTSKVQVDRKEMDVFPTLYKCNTTKKIRQKLNQYGFEHYVYEYEGVPSYLDFNEFFFFLGTLHQKFMIKQFKPGIFGFAQKDKP